ncbi:unnamed protein product [Durusdinium trenchii]|uniref:Uncharacterized protein n=1 Tax=Durusdinium trenchii TaxID=1381693 RepID=A0ABP0KRG5_9DINO
MGTAPSTVEEPEEQSSFWSSELARQYVLAMTEATQSGQTDWLRVCACCGQASYFRQTVCMNPHCQLSFMRTQPMELGIALQSWGKPDASPATPDQMEAKRVERIAKGIAASANHCSGGSSGSKMPLENGSGSGNRSKNPQHLVRKIPKRLLSKLLQLQKKRQHKAAKEKAAADKSAEEKAAADKAAKEKAAADLKALQEAAAALDASSTWPPMPSLIAPSSSSGSSAGYGSSSVSSDALTRFITMFVAAARDAPPPRSGPTVIDLTPGITLTPGVKTKAMPPMPPWRRTRTRAMPLPPPQPKSSGIPRAPQKPPDPEKDEDSDLN